ncbi:phage/plasmid primase, P4 family [uncultured Victivallis sp.]|uniref:DNA primase family protein n=1 Tax=uncultured Victivallis sp. TaxID=354118 RepID=UPI0025E6BEB2|nr:phage/plasmid primase, P4 family [uncultured Victivallis sp.]
MSTEGKNITAKEMADNLAKFALENVPGLKEKLEGQEKQDRRQITSPKNGKNGGRNHLPVDIWAQSFIERRYRSEGIYTLRRYVGQWYEFHGNHWRELSKSDLESDVMGFLQDSGIGEQTRLSGALVSDIIKNMQSSAYCNLHSGRYQIPCFLPSGENAAGWLPMRNAVINIEAAAAAAGRGEPLPPSARRDRSPALFATFGLDYDYAPGAMCHKWDKYISEVQPEAENREMLQMLAGLALVPDCRYNVGFFLFGPAGTGKSVFVNVLTALVGKENCCNVPLARLADRFGLAPLTEKLLNIVGELPQMPENGRSADVEGFFKSITSGDEIPVERKGIDGWKARAIARMVFATNVMPAFTDRSAGVWDRVRIIPFNQVFRGKPNQNHNLTAELLEELPGIFNWALLGLAKLRTLQTFPECPEGKALKEDHRNSCDHERAFLQEFTEAAPGGWTSSDNLYKQYREWTLNNGYRAVGAANFKKAVKALYPQSMTDRQQTTSGKINIFRNMRIINKL